MRRHAENRLPSFETRRCRAAPQDEGRVRSQVRRTACRAHSLYMLPYMPPDIAHVGQWRRELGSNAESHAASARDWQAFEVANVYFTARSPEIRDWRVGGKAVREHLKVVRFRKCLHLLTSRAFPYLLTVGEVRARRLRHQQLQHHQFRFPRRRRARLAGDGLRQFRQLRRNRHDAAQRQHRRRRSL